MYELTAGTIGADEAFVELFALPGFEGRRHVGSSSKLCLTVREAAAFSEAATMALLPVLAKLPVSK